MVRKLRQEDCLEFKVSLVCLGRTSHHGLQNDMRERERQTEKEMERETEREGWKDCILLLFSSTGLSFRHL